ncbi:stage II sporulation protein E [Tissierella sp. MSJ-40]|uniref:Stage II sporulation protein E n=1 Tax=Tissierella simiarum TaxID=2841534 RepID=A0ABS6EAT9_9FIRM|nr:stage II sporulation protein E [Tissierella simiarum]MBU5439298.1 stage II sporulation protein E [Tissierella simiarum]
MTRTETLLSRGNKLNLEIGLNKSDVLTIFLGFFLGRANILDKLTPFGIAFLSAYIIMKEVNIYLLISILLGTFTFQGFKGFTYLVSSVLIISFFKMVKEDKDYSLIKSAIISSSIFTVTKILFLFLNKNFFIYDLFLTSFEGIVIFTMTYIFSFSIPLEAMKDRKLNSEKIICTFITLALVLSGFSKLSILGISIKNIVSTIFILYFSYSQGAFIGTSMGIILGMVSYISQPEMPFIIAIYGVAGLLSGVFRDLGKIGSILGFVLGNGIISFYISGFGTSFVDYKEIIISIIFFIFFSKYIDGSITEIIEMDFDIKKDYAHKKDELTIKNLTRVSNLFNSLSDTFKESANERDLYSVMEVYGLVDGVANGVCNKCPNYKSCWESNYYTTYYSFFNLVSLMEVNSEIDEEMIPSGIKNNCINQEEIIEKMKRFYELFKLNHSWKTKLLENRILVAEQLEGLGKVVENLINDIYKNPTFNEDLEEIIYKDLRNNRIDVSSVAVAQLEKNDFEVFIDINNGSKQENNRQRITNIVSNTLGVPLTSDFTLSNIREERQRFKLIRNNRYSALTKMASMPNSEDCISGDNYTFGEVENTYFSALSDGMGIGKKANIESSIAINLLEKFMEANVDKKVILKTINSILRAKSNEEIFTTLDLSFIDLYTGKLQMIKTGAPATFVKKKDRVEIVNTQSLPVGILKDVDFNIYEEYIEDGDIIIMMSDGVLEASRDIENTELWMKEIIMSIDSINPQVIANKVLERAKEASVNNIRDDMTVLVTKVWKNV